jgi:hypothetical protein
MEPFEKKKRRELPPSLARRGAPAAIQGTSLLIADKNKL